MSLTRVRGDNAMAGPLGAPRASWVVFIAVAAGCAGFLLRAAARQASHLGLDITALPRLLAGIEPLQLVQVAWLLWLLTGAIGLSVAVGHGVAGGSGRTVALRLASLGFPVTLTASAWALLVAPPIEVVTASVTALLAAAGMLATERLRRFV